ncbi:MAG: ribonuclease E/G [Rhodobacteraceae bacterium CG17_big_fil_post_rev_8_21_14_2_50_65_11]|nr:MAG: ribonuclease E/G [Rhodobacteraceae bacterium CG17_big_fil_post_rev_8_21_14_2_50_65_11]
MAKKMLIDATHAEETRVVVADGNKVEEFDFESLNKRQLAGNIYLAKITRVEPSLQAAFVDYGGNRHGFLAFSEIHPDYYQIPAADRAALLAEEEAYAEAQANAEAQAEAKPKRTRRRRKKPADGAETQAADARDDAVARADVATPAGMNVVDLGNDDAFATPVAGETAIDAGLAPDDDAAVPGAEEADVKTAHAASEAHATEEPDGMAAAAPEEEDEVAERPDAAEVDPDISTVADDDHEEDLRPVRKPRPRRYKIQEVVKVRQIMLVQVVKEERGNKGAALTTYLSLAGRYCVLMPNTARGGGISRKITNAPDRKKLKEIATSLDVPQGAGLIVRTAGAKRTKTEIKRDYEYLQRQWEQIRDLTLRSIAPAPVYQEGDLIHRSIRDLYNRDIDEVLVEGEAGYRHAKSFMKMIMPSHAKNVKHYADPMPLFARFQVEGYLADMFNPVVQLKSGGYIVIDVTEALVAIDVNSGRATKEGSIEETATKTNLEAAEEVARQLRLRDLAGLIVIDFIDMDERKNNAAVEKRLKDKLKTDRARIQVGRISGFGLMEMSRQRLRPGMIEATTAPCPHCHGTGLVRSDDSLALSILRQLEEEGTRGRSQEVLVTAPVGIVNFIVNAKRDYLAAIEARYGMAVRIEADPMLISPDFKIEKFKTATRRVAVAKPVISMDSALLDAIDAEVAAEAEAEIEAETVAEPVASPAPEAPAQEDQPKKRRRRRRGGRGRRKSETGEENGTEDQAEDFSGEDGQPVETPAGDQPEPLAEVETAAEATPQPEAEQAEDMPKRKSRPRRKKKTEAPIAESVETTEPVSEAVVDGGASAAQEAVPAEQPAAAEVAATPADAPAQLSEQGAEAETVAIEAASWEMTQPQTPRPDTPENGALKEEPVEPAPSKPAAQPPEDAAAETEASEEQTGETDDDAPQPAMAGADDSVAGASTPKKRGWWSLG